MEKHVYFVRHGQTESNVDRVFCGKDAPLTDEGRVQAAAVAQYVAKLNIESLISSDYVRAKDTAAIISDVLGVAPKEQALFGEWLAPEGLLGKAFDHPDAQAFRDAVSSSDDPEFRYSTEESFAEMKERAIACYAYLGQHPASRLCVVTHLGFLRVLAGVAILDGSFGKAQHLSLLQHLEGSNTGITHVRFDEEKQRWKLVTWNDISHIG